MAYDFYQGNVHGQYLGYISYNEEEALWRICKKGGRFFQILSSLFYSDHTYSRAEIEMGEKEIRELIFERLELLTKEAMEERQLLYKLWAILLYVLSEDEVLFGYGD